MPIGPQITPQFIRALPEVQAALRQGAFLPSVWPANPWSGVPKPDRDRYAPQPAAQQGLERLHAPGPGLGNLEFWQAAPKKDPGKGRASPGRKKARSTKTPEEKAAQQKREAWHSFIFDGKGDKEIAPVSRDDIKGIDPVLDELDDLNYALKNYKSLQRLKPPVALPPGLLFSGPPGSGKTFTSQYMATNAGARLVNVNLLPQISEKGFTRDDIRLLFELSAEYVRKKKQPVILFWDELDKFTYGGSPQQKEAVAELTTQLSGLYGGASGVLVVATTNQMDRIPADLKREGRLGHIYHFKAPDRHGRRELLEHYVSRYPHDDSIDYESLVDLIPHDTVASKVASLVDDAYRQAAVAAHKGKKKPQLTQTDVAQTLLRKMLGQPVATHLTPELQFEVAVHEIGHAVVGRKLKLRVPVTALYSQPRSYGRTFYESSEGKFSLEEWEAVIAYYYGGEAAQDVFGMQRSQNLQGDMQGATNNATAMVINVGVGRLAGIATHGLSRMRLSDEGSSKSLSDDIMKISEAEVMRICRKQRLRARRLMKSFGKARLRWMAERLLDKKILLQDELDAMIAEAEKKFRPRRRKK